MRLSGKTTAILFNSGRPAHVNLSARKSNARELACDSGFTLIEVLIVVAILGIVAAVVIMNVTGLAGAGTVNAANTEAHQVQTALIAYMEASHLSAVSCTVGDGSEESDAIERYLLNPAQLQARYTVSSGKIVDALPYADGKWAECTWDAEAGQWRLTE